MLTEFGQITKVAMALQPRQKLALAEFLLESADGTTDPDADASWDSEIGNRIRAIDEGRIAGISYAEVLRAAQGRLVQ